MFNIIYIYIYIEYTGWWLSPTPLKNDGVRVSWDDYSIPNWMESHSKFHGSSHHQPDKEIN